MLTEVFNTPKNERRASISNPKEHSLSNDRTIHLKSAEDLKTSSSMEHMSNINKTETECTTEINKSITQDSNLDNEITSAENQSTSVDEGPTTDRKLLSQKQRSLDTVLLESHKTHETGPSTSATHPPNGHEDHKPLQEVKEIKKPLKPSRLIDISANNRPKSATVSGAGQDRLTSKRPCSGNPNKTKKRQLPAIKPISAVPSQSLLNLVEQKRKQELAEAEAEGEGREETDSASERTKDAETNDDFGLSGPPEDSEDANEKAALSLVTRDSRVTPVHKSSLPVSITTILVFFPSYMTSPTISLLQSPAWSQHSADLCQVRTYLYIPYAWNI